MAIIPSIVAVTVALSGTPGNPRDWVGLFEVGGSNNAIISWAYVACGNQSCPNRRSTDGNVTFKVPFDKCGPCEFRLMSATGNNTYKMIETIGIEMHGFSAPFP